MRKAYVFAACMLALAACNKMPGPGTETNVPKAIRIAPVMTRATDTSFENNDAIGLTVTRASGAYATNSKLTYNGLEFSSDLNWYPEGSDPATLAAYYPYASAAPASFSVAADQSSGVSSSDFIAAIKEDVLPSVDAVVMPFRHKLSKIVVNVRNNAGYTLDALVIKGAVPTAVIAADYSATADPKAAAADIKAFKSGDSSFEFILPPQTASLTIALTASGNLMQQKLAEATLAAGKKYSISLIVNPSSMKVVLSGEIDDWEDGGDLKPDDTPGDDPGPGDDPVPSGFVENLPEGWFAYGGVRYGVGQMKDGKWWMLQNLRFVPDGMTVSTDLSAVTAGVFAPLRLNEGHTGLEFTTDPAAVAASGYLYQAEVALGLKVGDLTSVSAAEALEGAQGICPAGWHLPTLDDIVGLVGKSVGATTDASAPYYDAVSANGSIVKLNEDGFGMDAFGAVTVQDNTKTTASFMGWASGFPDKISSGMFCGSTFAGVSYNTSGDESSGVKNLQFYGFMPMTNKASESAYTCNGTKVSYRIACPVRCVRNAE